jgi:hypothetical protein
MEWIVKLYWVEMTILLGSIVVNFALGWWNPDWLGWGVMVGFPLAFVVAFIQWYCFYDLVKCPACNGKLNRFKNGNRVPIKQAHTQLRNGYGCRHCGWKPDVPETVRDLA